MKDRDMNQTTANPKNIVAADIDHLFPNTIRFLAADAVQKAGSGHPGAPMGMADMAWVLWDRFLKFDPASPDWPDRDRFVLSAGHSCLVLYSLLHLYGFELSLDDLKNYRQWGSRTPGHPEFGHTPGVETTTGPLGQGVGNAVGMALAERHLAARFNRDGQTVVDHSTWCLCSDGDLMEGVASEAASLAGHLKLGKLNLLYDDNRITIGGTTDISFSEDVGGRFVAYGWHVQHVDGHDHEATAAALAAARDETDRPSLVVARTHIGYGSPNLQDTSGVHGSPLGEDEMRLAKQNLGWPETPDFLVPDEVKRHARGAAERGGQAHAQWIEVMRAYQSEHPDLASEFDRTMLGGLADGWDANLPVFEAGKSVATRSASGKVLNALADVLPEMLGGSADLEPSNKSLIDSSTGHSADDPLGRNIHFGVREHAVGALCNGMAYHGGLRPYCATFLVFSDYQRPSVRIAALAGLKVVYIYTHDSIGVGGDGPTHQPVEHVESLRAMPGLTVLRPADANETREAWKLAIKVHGPVALILTRQNVPVIEGLPVTDAARGAYIALDAPGGNPDSIIIATGSELHVAFEAGRRLQSQGTAVRVVNMPSQEIFDAQPESYQWEILPPSVVRRLAVEAGTTGRWWKYVGRGGDVLGIDQFGASAPGDLLMQEMGFTAEEIQRRLAALVG